VVHDTKPVLEYPDLQVVTVGENPTGEAHRWYLRMAVRPSVRERRKNRTTRYALVYGESRVRALTRSAESVVRLRHGSGASITTGFNVEFAQPACG
jgi:hypothetical protein